MKYSTSSLNTSFRCLKLFDYTYNDKLEPVDSSSFEANYGRAFHGLLEGDESILESSFGAKWQAVIRAHHHAYTKYWEVHEPKLTYHEHEIRFSYDLAGETIHGIIDGVADLNGQNVLVESKTTGTGFEDFMRYKEHVLQPAVYLLAAKLSPQLQKYNITGLVYDVSKRPSIRQKKTESDAEYVARIGDWCYDNRSDVFNRKLITKSDDYLDDVAGDIMMQIDTIKQGRFPKNRDACYAFRQQCGFHAACFENEELTNNELFQVRKRR